MKELADRLSEYLAAVIRYRLYAVMVAVIVCLVGWAVGLSLPDKYRATARIYVDTKTMLQPLLRGVAIDRDVNQEISAMQESLLSRPNLERVLRETGLDAGATSPGHYEDLIARVRSSVSVGAEGPNIFAIDVVHRNGAKAAQIAQALVDVLIDSSVGLGREDMEQASRFLDAQIAEYERQLEAAEARVAAFKQENLAYLPSSGSFQSGLDAAKQQEKTLTADLRDARTELAVLKAELAVTPQTLDAGSAPDGDASQQASLQAKLAEMLTRLTEKHPDVIALRRKIEEAHGAGEAADTGDGTGHGTLDRPGTPLALLSVPNPGFATLRMRVIEKEAEVAKLQEKLKLAHDEVLFLESRAFQAPQVEAQMTKLNRDYNILKGQYEQFLARREQARVSRDRDESGDKVQFRIVDPPRVPALPKGPPRKLLLTVVWPLACAAGIGAAIGLSLLRSAYFSPRQLAQDMGLPVIGSVSFVPSPTLRARHRLEAVAGGVLASGLLLTYGLLMTVEAQVGLGKVVEMAIESHSLHPPLEIVSRSLGAVFAR